MYPYLHPIYARQIYIVSLKLRFSLEHTSQKRSEQKMGKVLLRRWSTFLFNSWKKKVWRFVLFMLQIFIREHRLLNGNSLQWIEKIPLLPYQDRKSKSGFRRISPREGQNIRITSRCILLSQVNKIWGDVGRENVGKLEQIESFPKKNMGTLGTTTSCWREHIYGLLLKCMALNENDVWKCCPCQANVSLPVWVWVWKENRWLRNCKRNKSLRWKDFHHLCNQNLHGTPRLTN